MKRFLVVVLLLITPVVFAKDSSVDLLALTINLIDYIESYQSTLNAKGYDTEYIALSDYGRIFQKSRSVIELELTKGTRYVFYTVTDGPQVSVYCVPANYSFDKDLCSEPSNRIITEIIPQESGSYRYYIESRDVRGGLHITCFTKLYRKEQLRTEYERE